MFVDVMVMKVSSFFCGSSRSFFAVFARVVVVLCGWYYCMFIVYRKCILYSVVVYWNVNLDVFMSCLFIIMIVIEFIKLDVYFIVFVVDSCDEDVVMDMMMDLWMDLWLWFVFIDVCVFEYVVCGWVVMLCGMSMLLYMCVCCCCGLCVVRMMCVELFGFEMKCFVVGDVVCDMVWDD